MDLIKHYQLLDIEDLWELVANKNFPQIIAQLSSIGVPEDKLGEVLFDIAKNALKSRKFESAKSILFFLLSVLEDKSESDLVWTLIGDVYFKQGDYISARQYYAKLSITVQNITKMFDTFLLSQDLDGVLFLRNDLLNRLSDSNHIDLLHKLVHDVFVKFANTPVHVKTARNIYLKNIENLKKIDESIIKKISDQPLFFTGKSTPDELKYLKVDDSIFLRNNGVWEKIQLRPNHIKLKREHLVTQQNMIVRCSDLCTLLELRNALTIEKPNFYKFLCYVIVDLETLENFMAIEDLSPLSDCDLILKFIDENNIENELTNAALKKDMLLPKRAIYTAQGDKLFFQSKVNHVFEKCQKIIEDNIKKYEDKLCELYPDHFYKSINTKIKKKKIRILFKTSIYTTFLQHATDGMAEGFRSLGHEAFIEKEKRGDSVGIRNDICLKNLVEFKPDIIFSISHFRYSYSKIPSSIPFVTWIQDKLKPIASGQYLNDLTNKDFLFSHKNDDELVAIGYKNITKLNMPVNTLFFNKAPKKKKHKYEITFVNHMPSDLLSTLPKQKAKKIFIILAKKIRSVKKRPITINDYYNLFKDILRGEPNLEYCLEQVRVTTGNYLSKTIVLNNLIEEGYRPILFGNGWKDKPEYSTLAKGKVAHGKELATVYNESKINLHMHPFNTTGPRVFEAIGSGGFLLIQYIDPNKDLNCITNYLDEGEGFIYFYDKYDLIKKVQYYLKNDDERVEIINRGRKKVLQSFTYEQAAQLICETILKRFTGISS